MNFTGEQLFPGQLGHLFIILSLFAAILSTIFFAKGSFAKDPAAQNMWLRYARGTFIFQVVGLVIIFSIVFYICANHMYEYMYAYKHASKELESKYLLACIWEGQEGSFLLWSICHGILGLIVIGKRKAAMVKGWEPYILTVISLAQVCLLLMILGVYVFDVRIGNSLFTLTRNEIDAPIFSRPDYLSFVKDGMGLNILLRNYWMVIHPPVLFMGFATTIIPFGFAYGGLVTKNFKDWVKPAIPWTLLSACILGVGIMMGGKWAYESLSFGGYWAWDPVENASLVPWLILIAGLHTMLVFQATGHSLRATHLFALLPLCFVFYSTFLTRTGVLGDTSVHAFTEAGKAINVMILMLVMLFTLPSLILFAVRYKSIPAIQKEENSNSREFWMFIGSLVFFFSAIFIIVKTSVPVINTVFGTSIAPPEDVEFSYNKVAALIAVLIGLLTAVTQYLKYKTTRKDYLLKKLVLPTVIAALITVAIAMIYPLTYSKQGAGFLGAIYLAFFAAIYSFVANAMYIWTTLKGRLLSGGAAIAHGGFALLLIGILISSANKQVISSSMVNGINFAAGTDPMTKQQDDPLENLTLIRDVPTTMGDYLVTYKKDSLGHEEGRKFFELEFLRKNKQNEIKERFVVKPDVYIMKDNNMSSNPDTKSYLYKDVYTYISFALNSAKNQDTAQFDIREMHEGDTAKYSKGYIVLNAVQKNPNNERFHYGPNHLALGADVTVYTNDNKQVKAMPVIEVDSMGVMHRDDTLYAQNLYLRFEGVADNHHIKLGIKESSQLIDFVTVKTYVFPFINLVWLGLIIMAIGLVVSMVQRGKFSPLQTAITLGFVTIALGYMFLFAGG